jgi:hypothetical protein
MKLRQLNCDRLANGTAVKIVSFGVYLQWLDMDKQRITDVIMIQIAESCPNITSLCI